MSKFKINTVSGNGLSFGDNNTISNSFSSESASKVLTRDEYFQIILEIREIERISLGDYLDDKYLSYAKKNPDFVKIIYKDIVKVLDGVDMEGDNDLLIENGSFVVEYGDCKQTGFPTNLHYALTWLHVKLIDEFSNEGPLELSRKLSRFENDFLNVNYDSPSYSRKIAALNSELRKERQRKDKTGWSLSDLNDIIQLKPNIYGMGLNFNALIGKFIRKK